ncbi:hypothetical protein [Mesorhizobium silamurunense]|uniref:hypothetical protein n=1 Tax=Mesorhizobium silamurunense TaxID=499528 RepID=UPI003CCEB74E
MTSSQSQIGGSTVGTGTATVTGAGSTWTNSNGFFVGEFDTGTLTVEKGGTVNSNGGSLGATVGDGAGSEGTAISLCPAGGVVARHTRDMSLPRRRMLGAMAHLCEAWSRPASWTGHISRRTIPVHRVGQIRLLHHQTACDLLWRVPAAVR